MAKKKKKKSKGKLGTIILTALIVVALCIFVPKFVHKCDHCDKLFFGTGYEPNIIAGSFEEEKIICNDCEEEEYVVFGVRVSDKEDHKLPLFSSSSSKSDSNN